VLAVSWSRGSGWPRNVHKCAKTGAPVLVVAFVTWVRVGVADVGHGAGAAATELARYTMLISAESC
jgi:hypothetical protein